MKKKQRKVEKKKVILEKKTGESWEKMTKYKKTKIHYKLLL
jgi:hypothetical protein